MGYAVYNYNHFRANQVWIYIFGARIHIVCCALTLDKLLILQNMRILSQLSGWNLQYKIILKDCENIKLNAKHFSESNFLII